MGHAGLPVLFTQTKAKWAAPIQHDLARPTAASGHALNEIEVALASTIESPRVDA